MQRITVLTNGLKDTNCWPDHALLQNSPTPLLLLTAPPHYTAAKQPHPLYCSVCKTAPTKPKKLASTVTPLQNNWSPLQKELLRHAYSEAIYNYGEAELKDLSEPCASIGQFLKPAWLQSRNSMQQCWTVPHWTYFAWYFHFSVLLLIFDVARGVLWLVHYDLAVSALWLAVSALWHIKYIATTWQRDIIPNKCLIDSFSPTEVTLTPHTVYKYIALPGSIVDMYLCCHASHWFHVSSSAPPTVPLPYMGDCLRWTFDDKDRAFTLGD